MNECTMHMITIDHGIR